MTVCYRLEVAKKDERIDGPADADVVLSAPLAVVAADDFDATVEFMRGKLKATGDTGVVLETLRSGEADAAFRRLASQL